MSAFFSGRPIPTLILGNSWHTKTENNYGLTVNNDIFINKNYLEYPNSELAEKLLHTRYFDKSNLLKGEKFMKLNYVNEKIDNEFINSILSSPDKTATLLLGVLTRRLISIQYKALKSTPFINKLWSLSLDEKYDKILEKFDKDSIGYALLNAMKEDKFNVDPMVLNKLQEYNAEHWFLELEKEISMNLLCSEDNWNLTRDETSYYFVLGYTLSYAFDIKDSDEKDKGEGD